MKLYVLIGDLRTLQKPFRKSEERIYIEEEIISELAALSFSLCLKSFDALCKMHVLSFIDISESFTANDDLMHCKTDERKVTLINAHDAKKKWSVHGFWLNKKARNLIDELKIHIVLEVWEYFLLHHVICRKLFAS